MVAGCAGLERLVACGVAAVRALLGRAVAFWVVLEPGAVGMLVFGARAVATLAIGAAWAALGRRGFSCCEGARGK